MPKLRKKSAYTLKNEARKRKGIKLELCEPLNCRKEEIEGLESSTVDSTSKLENEKILETIYGKNLKLPFNYIIPRKITSDNLQNSLNDCHASTSKDISNSDTIKSSEKRKLWLLKKRQDPIYKSLQQKKDAERKQLKRKYPQFLHKESEYKKKMRQNPEVLQRDKKHKQKIRKQAEVSQKERQHKRDIRQNPEVSQKEKEHKQKIRKRPEVSQKERQHKRDVRLNPEVSQRETNHKQEIRKRPEVSQKERQHKKDVRLNPEVSQREKEHKQEIRKRPEVSQKERQHKRDVRLNPEVSQREKEHKQEIRKRPEVSQKERQHKRDVRLNPEVSQKEKEHKQEIRKRPEVSQKERQHKRDVRLNPEVSQKEKEHKQEIRKRPEVSQKERQHKRDVRLNPEVSQKEKEHKQEIRKRPEVTQKERQHKRDVRLNPEVSQKEKEHKQEIRKWPEVSQKERQHKRDVRLNPEVSQKEKEHKQEIRKRPEVSQKELQHKRDIRQNPEVSQREKEHKQEIRKRKEVSQKERQHKKNPGVLHKEKQHKRKLRLIPGILQKENQQKKIRLKANNIEELITKFHKIVTVGPLYICTCCKQLLYKKAVTETSKAKIKKGDNSAALARVIEKCVTGIKSVSGREWICKTCHGHLKKSKMPPSAAANGMEFPPQGIMRNLNPLEFTFLSPLLPFMKIHKAPVGKQLKIQGNMVVVPSDTVNTVQSLPRLSNNTSTIKAQLKRRLRHKHSVYSSNIRPEMVREGAKFLSQTGTLYKSLNIKYNLNWTDSSDSSAEEYQHSDDYNENNNNSDEEKPEDTTGNTENLNIDSEDEWEEEKHDENVAGSTDTLLSAPDFFESNERDLVYSFAPAENNQPISIFIEKTAEEQAYPGIFCGQARIPNDQRTVPVSYGEIVKSELRNMDRRCARNVENIFFKTKKLQMKYLLDQTNIALRKFKTDGQNLTAKDVKQKNVHNLIHLDQGYKVLKTLRGSPPYFQAISKELFAMIQTLGPATFFLTLSAAETQWVHLLRILAKVVDGKEYSDEELQNLTWAEKSRLIQSDPVTCARHFDHSLQSFMTNFILSDLHPVGNVTDWFSRIEFQQRGSPHVHMMIWCKNAPNLNDNSNEEICMYIDKFITCSIQNADDSLTTLVKLQQHKHSRTCKKKGKKICRFGFPKPPMQQTVILHPLEDTVTLKDNHKSNWNKIHDTLVTMNEGENISFKQFLEKVALNETEYILAVRSSIATPTVFLKRSLLEIRINNYSTACLKAWRANMDLQFVIDVYACAVYIASYITKTQRGMSELLTAACKEANSGNKSIREQVRLISNKFLNAIEISAQEASYLSLQLPLKKSSRQVIFINTSPPDQRVVLLKPQNQLESMNDDDDEIECKGLLSRYPERPKSMETLSLAEFASSYERVTSTFISRSKSLCKNTKDGCLPEKQHDEDQEEDEDISYNKTTPSTSTYRERLKPKIIRSVHYNPDKDIENYHRELLMLYSPWRNEELDILAKCTTYTERFQELKPTIEIKRQLFEPYRRAIKYAEELLSNQPELDEGWNGIAPNTQHRDQQDAAQREKITNNNLTDYDIGPDLGVRVSATEDLNSYNELSNGKFCAHMRSLNQQQIQFVYNVVHQIKTSDKPVYHFLSGGAGVGKSFVTKALYQMILKFYNRRSGDDFTTPKVLLMAPTGKAAYHINGNTIHSTLRIPCNQSLQFRSLESSSLNTLQTKLGNVQLIFIDEISMVGFKMLNFIHQRLMEIKQSKEPFGGVSIIAVGDLFQLKPVMDSYIFQPPKSGYMPLAINLWEDLFCMTELTIIMRQRENKEFAELLNRLREGNHTSNDIELLKTQCIEENTTNYPHDTPHVFFSNKKVNGHNATIFQKTTSVKTTAKAKDRLIGNYKEDVITKVLESFQNKSTDVSQLSTILEIAENLTYEITLNLDC